MPFAKGHPNYRVLKQQREAFPAQDIPVESALDAEPAAPAITRFSYADLQEMGVWLVAELEKRYPSVPMGAWISKIRNWQGMNDALFLRCGGAVMLALMKRDDIGDFLVAEKKFLLGDRASFALLNKRLEEWARECKAEVG